MKAYRMTASVLAFALAMALAAPAWAAGSQLGAAMVVMEPAVYSLEISGGMTQYFASLSGDLSLGDDIVVTNTGNRGIFLSMLADAPPSNADGVTLSFANNPTPGLDELTWAVREHQDVDGPPVYINTTAQQISQGAMGINYTLIFHSDAKTGSAITVPGEYDWTATIIATDENAPIPE
jgi:hypothetical protein